MKGLIFLKTVLTNDFIKSELKKIYKREAVRAVFLLLICIIYIIGYSFGKRPQNSYTSSIFLISLALFVSIFFLGIKNIIKVLFAYISTEKKGFQIITDTLVDRSKKTQFSKYGGFYFKYEFIFELSGILKLQDKRFFKSDTDNKFNETKYNSAQIGDEFYIISVGRWKNILVYNKKDYDM